MRRTKTTQKSAEQKFSASKCRRQTKETSRYFDSYPQLGDLGSASHPSASNDLLSPLNCCPSQLLHTLKPEKTNSKHPPCLPMRPCKVSRFPPILSLPRRSVPFRLASLVTQWLATVRRCLVSNRMPPCRHFAVWRLWPRRLVLGVFE